MYTEYARAFFDFSRFASFKKIMNTQNNETACKAEAVSLNGSFTSLAHTLNKYHVPKTTRAPTKITANMFS